jgi:hypothetical protein
MTKTSARQTGKATEECDQPTAGTKQNTPPSKAYRHYLICTGSIIERGEDVIPDHSGMAYRQTDAASGRVIYTYPITRSKFFVQLWRRFAVPRLAKLGTVAVMQRAQEVRQIVKDL